MSAITLDEPVVQPFGIRLAVVDDAPIDLTELMESAIYDRARQVALVPLTAGRTGKVTHKTTQTTQGPAGPIKINDDYDSATD